MPQERITVLPENRIIIRTPSVWYLVTTNYLQEQVRFSKNNIFVEALKKAEKEYSKYDK